jgi:hypothetical protein
MLLFAGACALVIAISGAVLLLFYHAPAEHDAIVASACVAMVVQLFAFAIMKLAARGGNVIAGWSVGALLRFASLGVYALIGARALGLPSGAALVSLAMFFFVSMLVEHLLLNV